MIIENNMVTKTTATMTTFLGEAARTKHLLNTKMQPSDDPRKALTWLPIMGRRSVGRPRTTWHRMAQKERSGELGRGTAGRRWGALE